MSEPGGGAGSGGSMPGGRGPGGSREAELEALDRVRRRVAAIGFFVVVDHAILGLVIAAHVIQGQGRHGDAVGLVVMAGVLSVIAYVVIRLILGARLLSWWIPVAALPTIAGAIWLAHG